MKVHLIAAMLAVATFSTANAGEPNWLNDAHYSSATFSGSNDKPVETWRTRPRDWDSNQSDGRAARPLGAVGAKENARTIGDYVETIAPPSVPWPENRPTAPAFPPRGGNAAVPVQPAMCVQPDGTLCQSSYTWQR